MNATPEVWKPIREHEGAYEVSDQGRVRSLDRQINTWFGSRLSRGRVLHQSTLWSGRLVVSLAKDGKACSRQVHQLVAEAFIGVRPDGWHTCHNDGDPKNNRAENLRYDSPSENCMDMVKHGTHRHARKTHCPAGHPYDDANTHVGITKDGRAHRSCRACKRVAANAYYHRTKTLKGATG